jgi:hypothetical protein
MGNLKDYLGSRLNPCAVEYFLCWRAVTEVYQRYIQSCRQSTSAGFDSCIRHGLAQRDILLVACGDYYACLPAECKKSPGAPYGVRCCPGGKQACGTGTPPNCKDLQTDPNNCGSCGHDCGDGGVCISGGCFCKYGYYGCKGGCVPAGSGCP